MTGEQLRAELLRRPGTSESGYHELRKPVTVTAKHRIKNEIVKKKLTISRVYPRAYETTTGECKAFWPLFDCVVV